MPEFQDADFFAPAADIARRIRARQLSAAAVVEALTDRIGKLNPTLNAFVDIRLAENLKAAKAEAELKDRMLREYPNMPVGPLFGVPVAVKDDLAVTGMPLTNGSRLCPTDEKDFPDYQDAAVTRLRDAGAIVLGKTHLPEFGHKGTTDNRLGKDGATLATASPWDTSRTSGGSSGGSAAAVAAGLAYLAMGTDIAGSVRIPASCCGVVGHKPTFGLLPRVPSGNAFSLWMIGPLARSVADTQLAMTTLAGPHPGDRMSRPLDPADAFDPARPLPDRLSVAWYPNPTGYPVDPGVEKLALAALEAWAKKSGATVVRPKEPYLTADEGADLRQQLLDAAAIDLLGYAVVASKSKSVGAFLERAKELSPTFADLAKVAVGVDVAKYVRAQAAITTFCEERAKDRLQGVHLLATPTLACLPPDKALPLGPDKVNGKATDPHLGWFFTWTANVTGEPAVSVPVAWTNDGVPVGLQLTGRRGFDGLVLRAAASMEKALPWADRRPEL